jgi:hypothetical protein
MDRFAQPTIADDRRAEALDNCERADALERIARERVACMFAIMQSVRKLAAVARAESEAVSSGYGVSEQQLDELRAIIGEHIDDALEHIIRNIRKEA